MSGQSLNPLAGLRILDLSTVIAGPYGSEILGAFGADVIRVSPPPAGSPMPTPGPGERITKRDARTWAMQRNKRSICLDLKSDLGRKVFLDLVRASDVVFDNFRPGVLRRLRLEYADLKEVNPRIITCSITGFGPQGPWSEVASYDIVVQACSGAMDLTRSEDGVPCRWGVPIGDIFGALYALIGLMAALAERERTGIGQTVDVSMFDVQLAMNVFRVPQLFGAGVRFDTPSPRRGGAGAVPYGPFRCGDGAWLVIGVSSNYWRRFCQAMSLDQLVEDPRFATLAKRQESQQALDAIVESVFLGNAAAEIERRLSEAGVPVGRVNSIREAFEDPQAVARCMLHTLQGGGGQEIRVPASPLRFVGYEPLAQRPPSPVGWDTEAVLAEVLHYSPEARAALRAAEAIDGGAHE